MLAILIHEILSLNLESNSQDYFFNEIVVDVAGGESDHLIRLELGVGSTIGSTLLICRELFHVCSVLYNHRRWEDWYPSTQSISRTHK